jgi:hypothetical protein
MRGKRRGYRNCLRTRDGHQAAFYAGGNTGIWNCRSKVQKSAESKPGISGGAARAS